MTLINTSAWIEFIAVLSHGVELLTTDKDFVAMQRAGVPLVLT